MRVTNRMLFDTMTRDLSRVNERLFNTYEMLSSGKKVNKPSDDPVAIAGILGYKKLISGLEQYKRNIGFAEEYLVNSESLLSGVADTLTRLNDLALGQVGIGNSTPETRASAALEVDALLKHLISVGNTRVGDRVLSIKYGGTDYDVTVPDGTTLDGMVTLINNVMNGNVTASVVNTNQLQFAGGNAGIEVAINDALTTLDGTGGTIDFRSSLFTTTTNAYEGDSNESLIQVGPSTTVVYGLTGYDLFKGGAGGTDIYAVISDLKIGLEADNTTAIENSLTGLDLSIDQISNNIAKIGARLNGLDIREDEVDSFSTEAIIMLSGMEDADMAEVAANLAMQEITLQALQLATAKVFDLNLFNFIS